MAKGSAFERKISKAISLWWSEGKRDDLVWRTAGSGSRATSRRKKGKCTANSEGDLCYLDEEAKPLFDKFVFELKKGYTKKVDLLSLIDSGLSKNLIMKWWRKVYRQAKQQGKDPILIISRDSKSPVIVFDHFQPWAVQSVVIQGDAIFYKGSRELFMSGFCILALSDFFKNANLKLLKDICRASAPDPKKYPSAQGNSACLIKRRKRNRPGRFRKSK